MHSPKIKTPNCTLPKHRRAGSLKYGFVFNKSLHSEEYSQFKPKSLILSLKKMYIGRQGLCDYCIEFIIKAVGSSCRFYHLLWNLRSQ